MKRLCAALNSPHLYHALPFWEAVRPIASFSLRTFPNVQRLVRKIAMLHNWDSALRGHPLQTLDSHASYLQTRPSLNNAGSSRRHWARSCLLPLSLKLSISLPVILLFKRSGSPLVVAVRVVLLTSVS